MTKEQLQKGKELEQRMHSLENSIGYWKNAERVLEIVLKLPDIQGKKKETAGYDRVRMDCSNLDFKRLQKAVLEILEDKLILARRALDEL